MEQSLIVSAFFIADDRRIMFNFDNALSFLDNFFAMPKGFSAIKFCLAVICFITLSGLILGVVKKSRTPFFICSLLNLLPSLIIFSVAIFDDSITQSRFKNPLSAYLIFIIINVAITGLYEGLYIFLSVKSNVNCAPEICVYYDNPLAVIDEVDLEKRSRKTAGKLTTEKLGSKKPRLDDALDYYEVTKYLDYLNSLDLSVIEKATLYTSENVIKRCKNTNVKERERIELSDALSTIIKLYLKYENL